MRLATPDDRDAFKDPFMESVLLANQFHGLYTEHLFGEILESFPTNFCTEFALIVILMRRTFSVHLFVEP